MDEPVPSLGRRLVAEAVGTAFLLMAGVGAGIAARRLSPSDAGLQLFEAAVVTAFALTVLIWAFGPVSGAHINPCVTLMDVLVGNRSVREAAAYIGAQLVGGTCGVILSNLMFELPAVTWAQTDRGGLSQILGETIAAFGLLTVIFLVVRPGRPVPIFLAPMVGLYIGGAYFFTSSTSFANPAITISRMFSDTAAGIAPGSVPGFLLGQMIGLGLAFLLVRYLVPAAGQPAAGTPDS